MSNLRYRYWLPGLSIALILMAAVCLTTLMLKSVIVLDDANLAGSTGSTSIAARSSRSR